ncbi:MAG: hypothetical protein WCC06_13235 [Candidatus Aminicenantales bacterium]
MKKIWTWRLSMFLILISASFLVYTLHYSIFHDLHHIFIYLIGDIGFLFLDVLLVILLIERVLAQREKRAIMKKLNMVIGTFFSEVGLEFLKKISEFVHNSENLARSLSISPHWDKRDFQKAMQAAQNFSYEIRVSPPELLALRQFLHEQRPFLLRLLENPNLLEHDRFTDLLWAVFHLAEELDFRGDQLEHLPESDSQHLAGDLKRAYSQITSEWLAYTMHLKQSYPFLFSLAARINPFNLRPSPIIQS